MTKLLSGVALAAFLVSAAQAEPPVNCEHFEASVRTIVSVEILAANGYAGIWSTSDRPVTDTAKEAIDFLNELDGALTSASELVTAAAIQCPNKQEQVVALSGEVGRLWLTRFVTARLLTNHIVKITAQKERP